LVQQGRTNLAAELCVANFAHGLDVDAQLASLKKTSEWERAPFINKGWLGHAVRIEGDSDRRGEFLCSAARDGESSGGKDGGSFRVDLGEQAAGLPSGNAESFLSTCTRIARKNWMSV
jgi:hypothetical protein